MPRPSFEPSQRGFIIDGAGHAARLRENLRLKVESLTRQTDKTPALTVIIVGEDPASQVYVRNKSQQALEIGLDSVTLRFPAELSEGELLAIINDLNADNNVHGILVQLPLPDHISADLVIQTIAPDKDVDGFHVVNAGRLAVGLDGLVPCTPSGSLMLLKAAVKQYGNGALAGLNAVIVGRSNIVGKPMAQLLLRENCTVTISHSKTRDLADLCRSADILVAAIGRPRFIQGDWIKDGAYVIDVGINRIQDGEKTRLVGDVDFDTARPRALAITPVPKGVGPMTIACLLDNTIQAFCRQNGLPETGNT